jgi:DNA uptake protein ComE-like DNA-binding protein
MRSLILAATIAGGLLAAAGAAWAQAPATATPTKPPAPSMTAPAPTAKPGAAATSKPEAASKPAATLIDLNSATVAELQALKGVGPARAEAIVKGRPYKGKDELARKNIVPQNVYDDIKEQIVARQK